MGSVLGGTNPPKIEYYDYATDTLQDTYNLAQVCEGAHIKAKPFELEFEKVDKSIASKRKGIFFESIKLVWKLKLAADLTDFQTIFNIDPETYYLKLFIHNDDAVGHIVKVVDLDFDYHKGKHARINVVMEFKGIELESSLNLNEAD